LLRTKVLRPTAGTLRDVNHGGRGHPYSFHCAWIASVRIVLYQQTSWSLESSWQSCSSSLLMVFFFLSWFLRYTHPYIQRYECVTAVVDLVLIICVTGTQTCALTFRQRWSDAASTKTLASQRSKKSNFGAGKQF
jgi:hypothetical protein